MSLDLDDLLDALADKVAARLKTTAPSPTPPPTSPVATEQTWFTTKQAAKYLSVSYQLLEGLRTNGGGPEFSKVRQLVRYRREDLDAWMAGRKRRNTSEKPGKGRQ
jgi:excisionase family DNA binding protein